MNIKQYTALVFTLLAMHVSMAQSTTSDSIKNGTATINKDSRIDILGKKMAEYNEGLANNIHRGRGYRLMILSTTDRNQAMLIRSKLIQQFPEQKIYTLFQSPYIKLKFGNFVEREEAEKYQKQLTAAKIIDGAVYIVAETIEIKPDKTKDTDESQQ